ncbi:MAG: hypothetical protein HUU06_01325 [Planctomycetaceae bacterium]|nr:hypothetical protein [Planctomycetota bacterium]NUN51414.1 hypothetical protein [Planctomycetaceae bacterium]
MDREEVQALIREVFEEEALLIGGLVAAHPVDDEFVWRLMRNLDALRRRILAAIGAPERPSRPLEPRGAVPHPAVEEFLARLRRDAETGAAKGARS